MSRVRDVIFTIESSECGGYGAVMRCCVSLENDSGHIKGQTHSESYWLSKNEKNDRKAKANRASHFPLGGGTGSQHSICPLMAVNMTITIPQRNFVFHFGSDNDRINTSFGIGNHSSFIIFWIGENGCV